MSAPALDLETEVLRSLFDAMPQLGWTARPDGHIDYYNRRWYEYTGTTFEEMQGWGWEKVHDPDILPDVLRAWRAAIAREEPFEMEFPLRRHDGEMRWFLTRVEPMRDAEGRLVRWVGINTDIDAQRRAREALRQQSMESKKQLERLRQLFEQAPLPITFLEGPTHRFLLVNAEARAVAGGDRPLEGLPIREAIPEFAGSEVMATLDRVFQTGRGQRRRTPIAITLPVDGEPAERFFQIAIEPWRDPSGAILGVMTVGVEVTEEVCLRQRLEASRREAVEANRVKDDFLAMLGHELRNPLAPIETALQLMSDKLGDAALDEREVITRQVTHLTRLVDDLLDISRIRRDRVSMRFELVDAREIVERAVEVVAPLVESKKHTIQVSLPDQRVPVLVDRARAGQVLSNLLVNAARYTPPGGHITVELDPRGDRALFRVTDDGVGMAPELVETVFEAFVQASQDSARGTGGLGLGLAIARNLVRQMGGRLSAHSDGEGRGSRFSIELPLADEAELAPLRRSEPVRLERPSPAALGPVLVVDDNCDAAEMLEAYLVSRGYDVTTVFDGPAALQCAAERAFSVALIDIGLPGMDGYELVPALRRVRGGRELHCIAVSGYGRATDRERSAAAGFDQHLTKPVAPLEIDQALARACALRADDAAASAAGG